jgi:hypothetical protein
MGFCILRRAYISIRYFCRPLPVKSFLLPPKQLLCKDRSLDVKLSVIEQNGNIIMNWPLNYYFGSSLRGSRELSKGNPNPGIGSK